MDAYILTDDDKEYIRTYVAESSSDEQKKERRRECANVFGLSLPQVAAITAHTLIRANRALRENTTPEIPVVEPMPPGVAMDYDNPIKQKYRTTLKNFIAKHTDPKERPDMKVLCFPGRKCLEPPIYLDLGFKAENIVGVECEPSAFKEFLFNASKYGISVRTMDVLDVVDEQEWDVVNLDYCGPIHKAIMKTIAYLRMSTKRKGILGMNLLAGREGEGAQALIDRSYGSLKVGQEMSEVMKEEGFISMLQHIAKYKGVPAADLSYSEEKMSIKRDEGVVFGVLSRLGQGIAINNRVSPVPNLPQQFKEDHGQFSEMLSSFLKCFYRTLHSYGLKKDHAAELTHLLLELYSHAMAPKYIASACEQYSYISPSKQKFLVDLYATEFCRPYGVACDDIVKFINESLTAACNLSLSVKDGDRTPRWGFQVRDKKGFVHKSGLARSDTIEMEVEHKVVSSICMKTIDIGCRKMGESFSRDILAQSVHKKYEFKRSEL